MDGCAERRPRPATSACAFATWEAAAAALAGTRWARRVAGGKVAAAGFRPAIGAHRRAPGSCPGRPRSGVLNDRYRYE